MARLKGNIMLTLYKDYSKIQRTTREKQLDPIIRIPVIFLAIVSCLCPFVGLYSLYSDNILLLEVLLITMLISITMMIIIGFFGLLLDYYKEEV